MQLTLIKNSDASRADTYRIARVVYAQTCGRTLPLVEAMTSMIANRARALSCDVLDIIADVSLFDVLQPNNPKHSLLRVPVDNRAFQMCLRVVGRMMHGNLVDTTHGAISFHNDGELPEWAMSRGYIADIDGVLFYL